MSRCLVLFAFLVSTAAFSAEFSSLDFLKAVVNSDELVQVVADQNKLGWNVRGVEKTATFNRPGNFQFAARLEKLDEATGVFKRKSILFMTTLQNDSIQVSIQKH